MTEVFDQVIKRLTAQQWITLTKLLMAITILAAGLYIVGLSQNPAIHEAFHDVRHAAGFPCH